MIADLLKDHFRPSSPGMILVVLGVAVVWLYLRPSSRWPRRFLASALAAYWFMATPIGASVLMFGLAHGLAPLASRDDARGADAVVLLSGGARTFNAAGQVVGVLTPSSIFRAIEAARVTKLIGARLVVASGGSPRPDRQLKPESEMLHAALVGAGVPDAIIVQESASKTTREQAQMLPAILRAHRVGRFVLVTSPMHMRRSLVVFRAQGLDPIPSISPTGSQEASRRSLLVPSSDSLSASDEAIYDYAAWLYYWWNGWLSEHAG